jgi:hypothetical protein
MLAATVISYCTVYPIELRGEHTLLILRGIVETLQALELGLGGPKQAHNIGLAQGLLTHMMIAIVSRVYHHPCLSHLLLGVSIVVLLIVYILLISGYGASTIGIPC